MGEIWGIVARTSLGFTLLLILTRIMGKSS